MAIGNYAFLVSLIPIAFIHFLIIKYRFSHAGRVCSGDLLNYQEDAAKIAIYEDVLEINAGRFLIALLSISALFIICLVSLILYSIRAQQLREERLVKFWE